MMKSSKYSSPSPAVQSHKVLTSFAIASQILPFLGPVSVWKTLMKNLSKDTCRIYYEYQNEIKLMERNRKTLNLSESSVAYAPFSNEHYELLTKTNCFRDYDLSVVVGKAKLGSLFNKFLKYCTENHEYPKFASLKVELDEKNVEKVFNTIELLHQLNFGICNCCDFFTDFKFIEVLSKATEKAPQKLIQSCKIFKCKCENLKLFSKALNLKYFKDDSSKVTSEDDKSSLQQDIPVLCIRSDKVLFANVCKLIERPFSFDLDLCNSNNENSFISMVDLCFRKSDSFAIINKTSELKTIVSFNSMRILLLTDFTLLLQSAQNLKKLKTSSDLTPKENTIRLDINTDYCVEFSKLDVSDVNFKLTYLFSDVIKEENSKDNSDDSNTVSLLSTIIQAVQFQLLKKLSGSAKIYASIGFTDSLDELFQAIDSQGFQIHSAKLQMKDRTGIQQIINEFMNVKHKYSCSKRFSMVVDDRRGYKGYIKTEKILIQKLKQAGGDACVKNFELNTLKIV